MAATRTRRRRTRTAKGGGPAALGAISKITHMDQCRAEALVLDKMIANHASDGQAIELRWAEIRSFLVRPQGPNSAGGTRARRGNGNSNQVLTGGNAGGAALNST